MSSGSSPPSINTGDGENNEMAQTIADSIASAGEAAFPSSSLGKEVSSSATAAGVVRSRSSSANSQAALAAREFARSRSNSASANRKRAASGSAGSGGGRHRSASSSSANTHRDNLHNDHFVVQIDGGGTRNVSKTPSHHRRTSFFSNLQSESRHNSSAGSSGSVHVGGAGTPVTSNPYDFDGLANALTDHISSTQAQLQCSPYTLSFLDEIDEEFYTDFTVALRLKSWIWMSCLGVLFIGAMQTLMAFTLTPTPSVNEWFLIPMVYLPLVSIILFAYFAREDMVAKYLPLLSLVYVFISGPVFIIGRACTYFFELRYIYSVGIALISLAAWFSLAVASWKWQLASDEVFENKANFIWSGVAIVMAMFFMCALSYTTEWNNRLQFLSNQQLIIFNSKLQRQLRGLEHSYSTTIADLESPLEKAIASIKLLLASPHITGSQIRILHEILVCLNSSHLMAPDLYHQVTSGEVVMDKEEEKWLFNELVRSQKDSMSFLPGISEAEDALVPVENTASSQQSAATNTVLSSVSNGSSSPENEIIPIDTLRTPQVVAMLEKVQNYNFPIFDFTAATQNRPLVVMAHTLMIKSGLVERLQLPVPKIMNFMYNVENGYRSDLKFHNSIHAADVLHGIYHLCQLDKISGIFSDFETLSIYIAASIHDFDHPGVNNNFLIATRDKKALLYNDKSVLENHHCSAAFSLLLKPENNFFDGLDRKTFSTVRSSIVDMVLATDLAQHFDLLTRFKKKVVTAGTFDPFGSPDDKSILMQMLMKCSDVSNPTKEWPLYQEWINRILQEFYNQGDMEKKLGLPISPFMNRESPGPSAQKGFIEYIVYPLFEALESWTDISEIKRNLDASRDRFCGTSTSSDTGNGGGSSGATGSGGGVGKKHRKSLRPLKVDATLADGESFSGGIRSANELSSFRKIISLNDPSSAAGGGSRRASVAPFRATNFFSSHNRSHSTIGILSNVLSQTRSMDSGLPAHQTTSDTHLFGVQEVDDETPVPTTAAASKPVISKDADPFPLEKRT